MKLKAEIELGKRTAAIETKPGLRKDLVQSADKVGKADALRSMGVTKQKASVFERMAKHQGRVRRVTGIKAPIFTCSLVRIPSETLEMSK